jgi:methyl-accepting chemotaxis protein
MRLIHHVSIKQKLLILVAFMSICIGVVGLIGFKYLKDSTSRMDTLYSYRLIPVRDLNIVRIHNRTIESDMLKLMIQDDTTKTTEIMKDIERLDKEVKTTLDGLKDKLPADKFKKLQDDLKKFTDQRGQIIYYTTNGKVTEAIAIFDTFSNLLTAVNDDLSELADSNAALAEQSNTQNANESRSAYLYLLATLVICVLLSLVIGWWFSAIIANPIRKIVALTKRVAQGDLSINQLHLNSKDETGQLAAAINEMINNLKELIAHVHNSAQQVALSASDLMVSSEHTSKASESTASAVQTIHDGFQKQLFSIHETTRAMEDMAAGIQQIASGSEDVTNASGSAYEKATKGKSVINNTVATIEHLSSAVHDSASRIGQLGEKTKEIDKVIALITEIAEQTNLLSLNAAIEAARAGEHGRGFGVVAAEVKKLAEESSKAASNISNIVKEIQKETMALVSQISESVKQAEQGLDAAHAAGSAFEEIAGEVEIVSQQIVGVSATVEEMSAGSQQILASSQSLLHIAEISVQNTEDVTATTEETLASMEEVRSSSALLSDLASELDGLLRKFKTKS